MPLYHFHKDEESGRSWLEQQEIEYTGKPKEIPMPNSVDLEVGKATTFYACKADECDKKFRTAGLFAKHFNQNHQELKETSETWREYAAEMEVTLK